MTQRKDEISRAIQEAIWKSGTVDAKAVPLCVVIAALEDTISYYKNLPASLPLSTYRELLEFYRFSD